LNSKLKGKIRERYGNNLTPLLPGQTSSEKKKEFCYLFALISYKSIRGPSLFPNFIGLKEIKGSMN
jgi:hypothetical protein